MAGTNVLFLLQIGVAVPRAEAWKPWLSTR
jgi:hypothetical protein